MCRVIDKQTVIVEVTKINYSVVSENLVSDTSKTLKKVYPLGQIVNVTI